MVSYAAPVAPTLPQALGLDAEIQRLQLLLVTELPWLKLSYGKAYRTSKKVAGKRQYYPEVYAGGKEYRDVLPNDNVVAQSFFYPSGPALNPDREVQPTYLSLTLPVDLVFWVNLQKLDPTKDYRYENELITDVCQVLSDDGQVRIGRIVTAPDEVFKGFSAELLPEVVLRQPYAGFRLQLELYVTNALCKQPVIGTPPVVTPPSTGGGTGTGTGSGTGGSTGSGSTTPPATGGGSTTPAPVTLVTGQLPFSATWLSQTGTLPSNKLKNLFQEEVANDAIETYVTSSTPTTYVYVDYPDNFYLDSLTMYDGSDTAANAGTEPLQLFYASTAGGPLVPLGQFDGALFGEDRPLAPAQRVPLKRLAILMTGNHAVWMRRLRLVGAYPQGFRPPAYQRKGSTLPAQFGVDSYPFYATDPKNFAAGPVPAWVADLNQFGPKRWFMDITKLEDEQDDSILRFQPSYEANWDKMLQQMPGSCITLTNNFRSLKATFPDPTGETAKNAAWALGVDRLSPETYRKRGGLTYQIFARYGKVAVPLANLRTANGTTAHGWTGEEVHQQRTGLNYPFRLQVIGEFLKYWKGPDAQGTGAEAAVLYAVCLDGYNNTMGPLVGARNADPSAEIEVQLLFSPDIVEVSAFFEKLGSIYGYNADGSVKNAPRYLDAHWYCRDPKTDAGVAWENSGQQADLNDLQLLLAVKAPNCQVTFSEYGYSYDAYADRSYVPAAGGLTSEQRTCAFILGQGFWNCRNDIASAQLYDWRRGDAPKPTGPGVDWDLTCDVSGTMAVDAIRDVRTLFAGYQFAETLDQGTVLINRHTKAGMLDLYEVYGTGSFSLPVAGAAQQTKFVPTKGGWGAGVTTPADGKITGTAAGEMMNYYRASI